MDIATFPDVVNKVMGSWPNTKNNNWEEDLIIKWSEGESNFRKYGKNTYFIENKPFYKMKN